MNVFQFQITGIQSLAQFDVVMRYIFIIIAFIYHQCPVCSVITGVNTILIIQIVCTIMLHTFMVIIIELNRLYMFHTTKVNFYPLTRFSGFSGPIRTHIFIGKIGSGVDTVSTGYFYRFLIGEKHPAGEPVRRIFNIVVSIPAWVIAECCGRIHYSIRIECRRI